MPIIDQTIGDDYALYHSDTMEVLPTIRAGSVGFSCYSPPFPETYAYSNDPRDMSNCTTYEEGIEQYRYIVREISRVTKPGRLTAVHCMDLKKGGWFQRDFPGDIVKVHEEAGFHFFCRATIWKDPWLLARRTRMRSLMHKTIVNDSSRSRIAGPDYVLVFTRAGDNPEPIKHPVGLFRYAGAAKVPGSFLDAQGHVHSAAEYDNYTGDQRKNLRSHWIWRRYASPVWMDIRSGRLLPYEDSKENPEEKHVCALQLDVIDRCLTLWSNPGDVVLTPFAGVGSELCGAIMNGRKAIGTELKATYYRQAIQNIEATIEAMDQPLTQGDLFCGNGEEDEYDDGNEIEEVAEYVDMEEFAT